MAGQSKLIGAVLQIGSSGPSPKYGIDCHFKTPTGYVKAYDVTMMDTTEDYMGESISSEIVIQVVIDSNFYQQFIYPTRQNIEILLNFNYRDQKTDAPIENVKPFQRAYRGVLIDNSDAQLDGSSNGTVPFGGVQDGMRICAIQLIEPCVINLLSKQFGNNYRLMSAFQALEDALTTGSSDPDISDNEKILSFNFIEPDINVPLNTISIPQYTKIINLPYVLQKHYGGIYNFGISQFIKNRVWHVYPPLNLQRYQTSQKKVLTIYQIPPSQIPIMERTWTSIGNDIRVVCNGVAKLEDISIGTQMENGIGARIVKADKLFEGSTEGEKNKAEYTPENYVYGFQTEKRLDNKNYAPLEKPSNNSAMTMSRLAATRYQLMTLQWQDSDIHLIQPGMPVTVFYDDGNNIMSYRGTVAIATETKSKAQGDGLVSKVMDSTGVLVLLVTRAPVGVY